MGTAEENEIILNGADILPFQCVIEKLPGAEGETDENSPPEDPSADRQQLDSFRLWPSEGSTCSVNGQQVPPEGVVLQQGDLILLGKHSIFRFNHPAQANQLRRKQLEQALQVSFFFYSLFSFQVNNTTHISQSYSFKVHLTHDLCGLPKITLCLSRLIISLVSFCCILNFMTNRF